MLKKILKCLILVAFISFGINATFANEDGYTVQKLNVDKDNVKECSSGYNVVHKKIKTEKPKKEQNKEENEEYYPPEYQYNPYYYQQPMIVYKTYYPRYQYFGFGGYNYTNAIKPKPPLHMGKPPLLPPPSHNKPHIRPPMNGGGSGHHPNIHPR